MLVTFCCDQERVVQLLKTTNAIYSYCKQRKGEAEKKYSTLSSLTEWAGLYLDVMQRGDVLK